MRKGAAVAVARAKASSVGVIFNLLPAHKWPEGAVNISRQRDGRAGRRKRKEPSAASMTTPHVDWARLIGERAGSDTL